MKNDQADINNITGVILAGGRARRMDGVDKGLININNQPMIKLIIDQLAPQIKSLIINANRNIEQYQKYNFPVICDQDSKDFNGPLAGMLSAMKACDTDYILSVPCDSPFIPADLASRLYNELISNDADICVVHDGSRLQPVFALIKTDLKQSLQNYLDNGDRKIDLWYQQHNTVTADFSDCKDIAMNINTPDELHKLEQQLCEQVQAC